MAPIPSITEVAALARATECAARWGFPKNESAWLASGLNPWRLYEQYKAELAEEIDPQAKEWGVACRHLARILNI